MKFNGQKDQICVIDDKTDVISVMREVAKYKENAFYICDVGDIIKKYDDWKIKLPRVTPHYAVKCNNHKMVLETIASLGMNFDCASKGEIQDVMDLGVDSSRIIFANPAKQASHIRYASSVNVNLMTFDNEAELYKIKKLHPSARLLLRIRCDAVIAQCSLGMKYGCNPITEGPLLLQLARSLQLNVIGIAFHVGSLCGELMAYNRAINASKTLFEIGNMLDFNMHVLDIGGGFDGSKGVYIDPVCEIINEALDTYFPSECGVNIIAEPGRYFVASAFTLAAYVHSKRELCDHKTKQVTDVMYYITDGIYGSFNNILYDHAKPVPLPLNDSASDNLARCSIWGPTCDGLDLVIENALFPVLDIGDWIMFENMGAYTLAVATMFNGFPIPKVLPVIKESAMMKLKNLNVPDDHFTTGTLAESLKETDYPISSNPDEDFARPDLWNGNDNHILISDFFTFAEI